MTRTKTIWRRRLCMLFCVILIFSAVFTPAYADTAVITSSAMYSYFETYSSSGYWVDIQTPAHWITDTGEVAYCLQTNKDNPSYSSYYTIDGDLVYDEYVLTGLRAILNNGYPADNGGFDDEAARYATANAIRFWMAENFADGMPQYLNLNVNGDWIRGKYGNEDLFDWALYLLGLARSQSVNPINIGSLAFSPTEITLSQDASGQYFTGTVYLNKAITGDYSLMDNSPDSSLIISGHTGLQSETLTLSIPIQYENQEFLLCAYGMDDAPSARLFFWQPDSWNQQRLVTYVLDDTESVFVRGFLTIRTPTATAQPERGSLQITKTDEAGNPLSGVEFTLYDSAGNTVDTQATGSSGVVTFGNLPLGSYYYVETAALPGYVQDSTQHPVTISTNGQVVQETMTNVQGTGSLQITKTDEAGHALFGVEFTLYDSAGNVLDTQTTDSSGVVTFGSLPLGSYFYAETGALPGYVQDSTQHPVTISTNGQVVQETMTNTQSVGSLQITKTDEAGNALFEVEFTLYDSAGNILDTQTTDIFGVVTFGSLPLGGYYYAETGALPGYVQDSTQHSVTISTNGQVVQETMTNAQSVGSLQITKTDESGNALAGVHFVLLDSTTRVIAEGDTGADGTLLLSGIPLGTYSLRETATVSGYVLDETPRAVEITTNGQTVELSLTNSLAAASIVVMKTDAVTGAPLSGVHFVLSDRSGATVGGGGTGEDGTLSFPNLPLGTYTLTEIETQNGYILDSTPISITLDTNGQTVTQSVTNTPARGSVSILKTDSETGAALAGVHFVLRDEAGALAAEGDTAADGTLTLPNIPVGRYTLRETSTVTGYVLPDTPTDVNITENGQIVELSLQNDPIHSTLEILKRDAHENIALMGAGYRLYDSAGTQVADGYTDASGKVSFPDLAHGQYVYQEFKAPKRYLLDENRYSLSITENGATITETRTDERRPGTLIVQKQDADGSPLAGAAFLLEYSTDQGSTWQAAFYRIGDELTRGGCSTLGLDGGQLTTGADGKATFTGLRADGIILYRLTETKAPPGRTLLADSILVGTLPVESDNIYAEDSEVFDSRGFHYTLEVTATDASQYRLPETGGDDGLKILPFAMMFMATPIILIKTKRRFFA